MFQFVKIKRMIEKQQTHTHTEGQKRSPIVDFPEAVRYYNKAFFIHTGLYNMFKV